MRYHAIAIILLMISASLAGCTSEEEGYKDVDEMMGNIDGTGNGTTDGGEVKAMYNFDAEDSPTSTTDDMDDTLIRGEMSHDKAYYNETGDLVSREWNLGIEWDNLSITITTSSNETYTCELNGSDCSILQETDNNEWESNEVISLKEGGSVDICSEITSESCVLQVLFLVNGVEEGNVTVSVA